MNLALTLIFGTAGDLTTTYGFTVWRGLTLGGFLTVKTSIESVQALVADDWARTEWLMHFAQQFVESL